MAGLTWVFDSRYGAVTIVAGSARAVKIEHRRMMVNSGAKARLYTKASTSPERKLRDVTYGAAGGIWTIEGVNEATGEPETWTMPVAKPQQRCGSCGG